MGGCEQGAGKKGSSTSLTRERRPLRIMHVNLEDAAKIGAYGKRKVMRHLVEDGVRVVIDGRLYNQESSRSREDSGEDAAISVGPPTVSGSSPYRANLAAVSTKKQATSECRKDSGPREAG
jgi:hypothetical protein